MRNKCRNCRTELEEGYFCDDICRDEYNASTDKLRSRKDGRSIAYIQAGLKRLRETTKYKMIEKQAKREFGITP